MRGAVIIASLVRASLVLASLVLASTYGPARAADFYAGKTIEVLVGGEPGGGYDIYTRVLARHINRHIPGNPTIVVKNMPGSGSGRAAAFLATIAPKDGTVLGAVFPGAIIGPLIEGRAQSYDPTKFVYLGSADSGARICATLQSSKIKTYSDALATKTVVGASAAGGNTRDYANMQKKATGAKLDIVTGYKGTVEIGLAMERGEVDGICGWPWASVKSQKPDWLRDGKLNLLVQVNLQADPELTRLGVPELWTFIKSDDDRKAIELIVSQQVFARPYIAPPGTAHEQVGILRAAFDATMKDRLFLEEAERARIDVAPSSGIEVKDLVNRLYAAPAASIERAKELIRP